MNNANVLVVDDEMQICRLLEITLQSNGYDVSVATTAQQALRTAASHPPDLIILDLGLPDENGHEVLKKLRQWYTKPVIILSVQSSEEDIVQALDDGANDYLVKPFRTAELLARIRSTLRSVAGTDTNSVIDAGDLKIDLAARAVKKNGESVKLTSTEYALLSLLAQHEGKVLTHQFLLKQVWGPTYVDQSQYLRVYIAQLRKKIEDNPNKPVHLITESGVGYRFITKD
jgi:two-component system KDP operon response regulator KdpE